ncbi:restriction endonuclease subunit S [Enterococcus faecalis]|uniref:Type I restriction modification DNA specificity domain protein n=3 Tax=Enterococcus faecalis TaxID=1351 RepID=A0ABC9THS3_ENTFL|nr:restriction endonuclease subunit S [Enterococcus faecalis]EGO2796213.1 restriction endonuclease subunit S [Enterococcus faecalis]EGO5158913.1 restriction endonuclease subunit S [Enterococcus faecalis]EGO5833008.1 restriction endonuclease subunit S [Enterococcus faecalis]EGO6630663.1 restriction endonuclease subunit S [Enterococcus faecalis]EGO8172334.1 restriction endonuclease subunit S [Enterococcus faecalis]
MRDEMKKVPRLRFRGFQEDWELCKLGKLAEFNPKSNLPEKFEYVDLESVVGTELVGHRLENRDSAPSRAQRLAKKNDVFYQTVRPYQKNNYLFDLPYDNYVFSTGYAQMRPSGNGYFLLTLVQEEKFVNRVLERSTGTSYPAISSNDLAKLSVRVPADIEEEQNIGKFFSNLDNLVTLHQRKLEQLKEFKKAYLQVMFPEKDERVPKLRFADFEEEWEHRKLDDSIKVMDGDRGANYPHDTDFFKDGDTLFLDTGNVTKNGFKFDSVKYITNEKDEQLRAGKLEKNDFVLTSRGTLGNVGFYDEVVYNLHPKIRINSAMLILRNTDEQLSYSYLHTLLKGQLISDFMKKNQVGSAQPHITKSEFLKLNLNVPRNINEQNKIGNFFKSLDVTITLHQNKLTQLKSLKKSYLQNMFI